MACLCCYRYCCHNYYVYHYDESRRVRNNENMYDSDDEFDEDDNFLMKNKIDIAKR